jgi:hypothetical protein
MTAPRSWLRRIVAGLGVCAPVLLGCADDPLAQQTTVAFALDAPLCSSVIPVQFYIDSALVGSDTFRIQFGQPPTTSPAFPTTAGTHTLGASVINGYVWPDTTLAIAPGEAFALLLPLDCS